MLFLSKITILHIYHRFRDNTTKEKENLAHNTSQTSAQSKRKL